MSNVIKPPTIPAQQNPKRINVFLAGSIEMGKAEAWHDRVINYIESNSNLTGKCTWWNPRRDDWDSSWKQEMGENEFTRQVNWEQDALEAADIVFFYFQPGTQSPISLLELGQMLPTNKKLVVCCPEGFWRSGNVYITCTRYGNVVQPSFEMALRVLEHRIKNITK